MFSAQPWRVLVAGVAVYGTTGDVPRRRAVHAAQPRAMLPRSPARPRAHGPRCSYHGVKYFTSTFTAGSLDNKYLTVGDAT